MGVFDVGMLLKLRNNIPTFSNKKAGWNGIGCEYGLGRE